MSEIENKGLKIDYDKCSGLLHLLLSSEVRI